MESKVIFADEELKETFKNLRVENERLFKEIERALLSIQQNAFFGRNVKKKIIPKKFIEKYNIDNLWIYNLRKD